MQMTLECLRTVLGDNLGAVLTPELAAHIESSAFDRADHAFAPSLFPPRQYRNLTFQVESFRAIIAELDMLHAMHFAETEKHLQGFVMKPDYDYMAERERIGNMIQFVARTDDGRLAGNLRMYITRNLHTGAPLAVEDALFLAPEFRKGFAASSFVRYVEECLVDIVGIEEIQADTKVASARIVNDNLVSPASQLMVYRGYQHVGNKYVKLFPKKEAQNV